MKQEYVYSPLPFSGKISLKKELVVGLDFYSILYKFGLNPSVLPSVFKGMHITCMNKYYKVIGLRNANGGIEAFNEYKGPFTLKAYGVSVIKNHATLRSKECCLFSNVLDYLAYLTLCSIKEFDVPRKCDCIILNHAKNVSAFILECDHYMVLHTFFPLSLIGKTLEKTLTSLYEDRVRSHIQIYSHSTSLLEYLGSLN